LRVVFAPRHDHLDAFDELDLLEFLSVRAAPSVGGAGSLREFCFVADVARLQAKFSSSWSRQTNPFNMHYNAVVF
jgi:hypothetical protein